MKFKTMIAISLLTLLLSACASPGRDALHATSWKLSAIGGRPAVDGATVTISFEDGQVSGSGGCNSFGGEYRISGSKIAFDRLFMTEMACLDPAVMEQESAFMRFLGEAQSFELTDGQLQLDRSEGEALVFVPAR